MPWQTESSSCSLYLLLFFISGLVSLIDRRGFVPSDDSVQTSPVEIELPAAKNDINMVGRAVTSGRPPPPLPPPPVVTLQQPAISIQNHSTAWFLSVQTDHPPLLQCLCYGMGRTLHFDVRQRSGRCVAVSDLFGVGSSRYGCAALVKVMRRGDLCLLWLWKGNKCLWTNSLRF